MNQENHCKIWSQYEVLNITEIKPFGLLTCNKTFLNSFSYGIQGLGGTLVRRDYYNVEGLPLYQLCSELNNQLKYGLFVMKVNKL